MSPTSLPAVFLEHLWSLLDQGQPVYAALPEAARQCGYDQAIVAREWALLGADGSLSTFLATRISRGALAALRTAEERGELVAGLQEAQTRQRWDLDGLAHHTW